MKRSALFFFLFLAVFGSTGDRSQLVLLYDEQTADIAVGDTAPAFVLPRLDGRELELEAVLRENAAVVLKFWATWCPMCWIEFLELDEAYPRLRERGIEVLAIAIDRPEDVGVFLTNQAVPCPVLLDVKGDTARSYGVQALPTTVVVGRGGTILEVHPGLWQDLESQLTTLLTSHSATSQTRWSARLALQP